MNKEFSYVFVHKQKGPSHQVDVESHQVDVDVDVARTWKAL